MRLVDPVTSYMKQADRWFSKYIRLRDGHCLACGDTQHLQCAHILTRSYHAVRCHEANAVALCRACHVRFTHRPLEWEDWVKARFGDDLWDQLRTEALTYARQDWKGHASYWRRRVEGLS